MRTQNPFMTATEQGIRNLIVSESNLDGTEVRGSQSASADTVGDDIHIVSNGFAVSVLFSLPEDVPEWLADVEQKIDNMAWLEGNFDGEGSPAINPENINAAKRLVRRLFTNRNIQCTDVFPTAQAGVELELETKFWEATIWVNDPTAVEFFVKCGRKKRSGKAPLDAIPDKIWESLA